MARDLARVESLHIIADNGVLSEFAAAPEKPPPVDCVGENEDPIKNRIAYLGAEPSPIPPRAILLEPPRDDVDLSQPASAVDAWMCNKGAPRVDPPAKGPAAPENTRRW